MTIREAGDSALLLQLEPVIAADVNARAIAIAGEIRARVIPGVRDVVSTFRSVAVYFDPLATDVSAVAAALHEAAQLVRLKPDTTYSSSYSSSYVVSGFSRTIEVPVVYGGDAGPDLEAVAAFAGCAPREVIDRHASRTYRVFMLGFLPGFPYMGSVDDSIAAPRRPTPRMQVPAGSVGIAGRQTGIYPLASPGGWQIIGRTSLPVFDPGREPSALFAPGDQVRFVAVPAEAPRKGAPYGFHDEFRAGLYGPPTIASRFITVLRPGLLTTIQDAGRWGHQHEGVPVAGPMDPVAHRLANALVGNPREAAALEVTLLGPELRVEQDGACAITGADLQATVDGRRVALNTVTRCHAGSVIRFGERRAGARAYVAFDGGIAVPRVLGSRATHCLSGLGGIDGRAVRAGDRIPLGAMSDVTKHDAGADLQAGPPAGARLRVLPGPHADLLAPPALDTLCRTRFTVSPQSDRMGYRLTGRNPVLRATAAEMISDVTFTGAVQVPPSGDPILLMADRQTTGGYPQVAIVITADLPLAAQLAPGDWVEFEACARADAISALVAQEGKLLALR